MDNVRTKPQTKSGASLTVETEGASVQVRVDAKKVKTQAKSKRVADKVSELTVSTGGTDAETARAASTNPPTGRAAGKPGVRSQTEGVTDYFASAWKTVARKVKPPKQSLQGRGPASAPPATVSTVPGRKVNKRWKRRQRRDQQVAATGAAGVTSAPVHPQTTPGVVKPLRDDGATQNPSEEKPRPSLTTGGPPSGKKPSRNRQGRSERAAAKRARVEETMSPRVEPKKRCLEARPRVTYAQTVRSDQYVAVTDDVTGYISQEMSNRILDGIDDSLIREAVETPGKENPKFGGKPMYEDGHLKLFVEDQYSLTWLQECLAGLATPSNVKLVVKRQSEMVRRIRCGVLIPNDRDKWKTAEEIGRVLHYMNKWAQVERWRVMWADKQRDSWFLVLSVPEDTVPTILKKDRRLLFGSGTVYLRFQGPGGKFIRDPPTINTSRPNLVITGVTVPQTSTPDKPVKPSSVEPTVQAVKVAAETADGTRKLDVEGEGSESEDVVSDLADLFSEIDELSGRLDAERGLGGEDGGTSNGVPFFSP